MRIMEYKPFRRVTPNGISAGSGLLKTKLPSDTRRTEMKRGRASGATPRRAGPRFNGVPFAAVELDAWTGSPAASSPVRGPVSLAPRGARRPTFASRLQRCGGLADVFAEHVLGTHSYVYSLDARNPALADAATSMRD